MRHELMVALEEKQFRLVYQPVIDAHSGQLKSVEALIRWQHPQRGFISPAEFIPFAEQTGQIVVIGQWVLQQACQDIVEWNKKNGVNLSVAVNLSLYNLSVQTFCMTCKTHWQVPSYPRIIKN
jgi:EAL domain-containing protein (putative c-di-GMP-specific phosphodiesterase class I)